MNLESHMLASMFLLLIFTISTCWWSFISLVFKKDFHLENHIFSYFVLLVVLNLTILFWLMGTEILVFIVSVFVSVWISSFYKEWLSEGEIIWLILIPILCVGITSWIWASLAGQMI